MGEAIGRRQWAIAEGFIPPESRGLGERALMSHETACLLNAGEQDAHVRITVYFASEQ